MDQTQLNQPAIDIDIAQSDEAREKYFGSGIRLKILIQEMEF